MTVLRLSAKRALGRIVAAAFLLGALVSTSALASQTLSTAEARNHIGETATVCGHVAGAHYAARSKGQPTFINLDKPYPNAPFTVVIWGSDRDKFSAPETAYQDRDICAAGQIKEYRGAPEIVAGDPKQIEVKDK